MAPVMGVPTSAASEIPRNAIAILTPISLMSLVMTATHAGIILTYAPLVNPNRTANTTSPGTDLAMGSQQKMSTPDRTQFGNRMVSGPYVSASQLGRIRPNRDAAFSIESE